MKKEISLTVGGSALIFWAFLFFWGQSGWYRVDCALGQQRACDLITKEYEKKERP